MRIVIIEDEILAAEDLTEILVKLPFDIEIVKVLYSVAEAVAYFRQNNAYDLIFCDIQLGDGHSFKIFNQAPIKVPVIFCTAFNQYALEAFKNNGIDYILKPYIKKVIQDSIQRYENLKSLFQDNAIDYNAILDRLQTKYSKDKSESSLLINWKYKIIPVRISDIGLFHIEFKMTQLVMFDNQKYFINQTLDELESICGDQFYRANRQYLVNRKSISEVLQYSARKLILKLMVEAKSDIIISKNKVSEFLEWLRR
ncbi:MAG TPA: LytTR family DNA-binding domain-containing protein [Ferruginibacter sp.]|nr:LytTR family DNA-binding domain-containing protein [Ferruginibacter sp.]